MKKLIFFIGAGLLIFFGTFIKTHQQVNTVEQLIGVTPSTIYQTSNYQLMKGLLDWTGNTGTASQCLTSTGTSTLWSSCGTGGSSNPPPGIVATSTANYFAYYLNGTTVTGTPLMIFNGGAINFTTNTSFSFVSSTNALFINATTTNFSFTNANGTSITSTNLNVSGSLNLPANSVTDAMVVAGLTISGGTIDNSPIGASTASTGIFTSLTSTNATTTNLRVSEVTNLGGLLTFTTANGTSITSTNGNFSSSLTIPVSASLLTLASGNLGIDSTSGQLRFNTGSATSTIVEYHPGGFTIASSSLVLTASNTIPIGFAMNNQTWSSYGCFTTSTGGTLATTTVRFGNGVATWMTAIQATSSKSGVLTPMTTISSNNTFAVGAQRWVQIGNIVGTFDYISCSYKYTFDAD